MRHTDDDIAAAADRLERLADEARLQQSVSIARAHDRSWNQIAIALGVPRQAARQRFSTRIDA